MPLLWGLILLVVMTPQIILVTACYDRITSSGVTEPYGDIFLPLGSDLIINCSLNANYTGSSNSSDIGWQYKNQDIPSRYITILDSRSAQLHLENLSEKDCGNYVCRLQSAKTTVCLNSVFVGRGPPKPEELIFSCKSMHWKSLTCTWKSSFTNCAPTNWTLWHAGRSGYVACPKYLKNEKDEAYGCVFDEFTHPPYEQSRLEFAFQLFAQNKFNKSISHFRVNHFSRVVPSPPIKLVVLPMGSTKCRVVWEMEKVYDLFSVPLVYNLEYRSQWDPSSNWLKIEVVDQKSYEIENLVPYTHYFFRIRVRSKNATGEDMWSSYILGNHQTSPTVPTTSIVTTSSNFMDINVDMDRRDITLFWQLVPPSQYFGPQFHYIIKKFCEDVNATIHTANATEFLFKFYSLQKNKSYHFEIQAANQLGVSQHVGTISVPEFSYKPPEAEDLTLILYGGGMFKVSWKPPESQTLVSSYSLVWCKGKAYDPRLDPCYTPLNWTEVMGNKTSLNVTLNNDSESSNYRFGVAVNSRNASSGLTWSKCIAPHNGVLSKMKMPPLEVKSPTNILVNWILDCSERLGIVIGFQVQYCLTTGSAGRCIDGELKKEMISGADKKSFVITGLRPFSYYRVTVAGVTEGGVGEPCDPQTVKTEEGAPGDPPGNLRLVSATNRSISIRWDLPLILNGVLTRFIVTYTTNGLSNYSVDVDFVRDNYVANLTKNIECYSNYTITVQACTRGGCSNPSNALVVTTEIGVPGQPEALKAREFNSTHILIEWEEPAKPNGPINEWNLLIMKYTEGENSTVVMTTNPYVLPMICSDNGKVEYGFAVQAVVVETIDQKKLIGPWSDTFSLNLCYPDTLSNLNNQQLIGSIIGGIIGVGIVGLVLFFVIRRLVDKIKKIITIPIPDMPDGLGEVNTKYSDFKSSIQHPKHDCSTHNQYIVDLLSHKSLSSNEGRESQGSAETNLHLTSSLNSLHEILNLDKTSLDYFCHKHNLSSDSSGCSTGDGSVSSSLTTRIHLSSDSGTEADFPGPPCSPDSVFFATDVWPTGVSPASNCQLRLRTNNNSLLRLGEEENDAVLGSGDKMDVEKSDLSQPIDNHYCKAAIVSPDIISVALEQDDNVDMEPIHTKHVTNNDSSPSTVYSRVALVSPSHPMPGKFDSGSKELEIPNGPTGYPYSGNKSGINTTAKDSTGVIRPSSYVTLSILSDTNGMKKSVEGSNELSGEHTELIPYSCVGLVGKPQPKTSPRDEIFEKSEPIPNKFNQKKENWESLDVASLSVPYPSLGEERTKQMPSKETRPKTGGRIQKKPKCSPYIALSGLEEPTVKIQCPGYSKVGQPEQMPDKSASRYLPKFESHGMDTIDGVYKESRKFQDVPQPAAIGGYVTLGLMDPVPQSLEGIPAKGSLRAGKISFDPTLNEEPLCDGSSWESELEISEENLTEEDIHAIVPQPRTSLGYVCVGGAGKDATTNYVTLSEQ